METLFSLQPVEVAERYDQPGGGVHVGDEGGVLAVPGGLLEVRGACDGPTAQPEGSHPEAAVLHGVTKMLR